jgi:hypothetical protein
MMKLKKHKFLLFRQEMLLSQIMIRNHLLSTESVIKGREDVMSFARNLLPVTSLLDIVWLYRYFVHSSDHMCVSSVL